MKFVKEYKLFESNDRPQGMASIDDKLELIVSNVRDKINNIFSRNNYFKLPSSKYRVYVVGSYSRINTDAIVIRVTIFKNGDDNRFTKIDIQNELEELSKIGFAYTYTPFFIERNGECTVRILGSLDAFDYYATHNMNNLDIKFGIMPEEIECSNPECDNIILDDSVGKCPVCGEGREL